MDDRTLSRISAGFLHGTAWFLGMVLCLPIAGQGAEIHGLIALRRAEIAVDPAASEADLAALERCEAAIERVRRSGALALHRFDLALDGREVMQLLGCGPGPQVGRALRHLTERVIEDPGANRPDRLREILAAWREDGSGG